MPKEPSEDQKNFNARRSIRQIVLPHTQDGGNAAPQQPQSSRTIGGAGRRINTGTKKIGERQKSNASAASGTRRPGGFSKRLWLIAAASVALLYIIFSIFFSGAEITITPRRANVSVDGEFAAYLKPDILQLKYETTALEDKDFAELPMTGKKYAEEVASGLITVYNDFSEKTQRLIKNTRFESPEGLIFRIPKSIIVPGQSEKDGKLVPGSLKVEVFADSPGEMYNIAPTRFSIPGLKGDPRYSAFWAESDGPMKGGFVGDIAVVDEAKESALRSKLDGEISKRISAKIRGQVSEGFIWFGDNAVKVGTEPLVNKPISGSMVKIGEKVTVEAILFDSMDFAKHIARATLGNYDGGDVLIENMDELSFNLLKDDESEVNSINFSLSGTPSIVWIFDEKRLKEDLVGKSKNSINQVLSAYPAISKAEVVIRPFWSRTFPKKISKINIRILPNRTGK